jgi:two-component system chemotaxis response regulator CheB
MSKVRVLVVEDSLTIRKMLCEVLAAAPDFEVVGEAEDGRRAIELCQRLRPDVVSLDMMLPVMTGLAATEYIMAHVPTPILIVSASTNRAELFKTYDALAAGAVDVLEKPRVDECDGAWSARFTSALRLVSRIKVITHLRGRHRALEHSASSPSPAAVAAPAPRAFPVFAIGASTGGPAAVVEVLRGLPSGLRAPILLVMHIDEPFSSAFADWLDGQTQHRVCLARGGESLEALRARVVMAPPGRHCVVHGGRLELIAGPARHSCLPSVDVLFESLAQELGASSVACLLTGMGRDGAAGLLAIRQAGGATIAQDEATSVVYGMPREAALLGAAEQILPLGQIGASAGRLLSRSERGSR